MLGINGESIIESRLRRAGFNPGAPAYLADGVRWFLPPIDVGLILIDDDLQMGLVEAVRLSRLVRNMEVISKEFIQYQFQIAEVGVRLLGENYDLTHENWERLTRFETLGEFLCFCISVSDAIEKSRRVWGPIVARVGQVN